jgi:hypothetical protein
MVNCEWFRHSELAPFVISSEAPSSSRAKPRDPSWHSGHGTKGSFDSPLGLAQDDIQGKTEHTIIRLAFRARSG